MFYFMKRVSDCDFTADKISVFMMIHHVLYPRSVLSNFFLVIDISRSFSGFWPTNNHVQYDVNCSSLTGWFRSPTRYALTSDLFSYQFLVMSSCFFFSPLLLKDDFLISLFILTKFRTTSAYTLNVRVQTCDIIEVNCFLIQIQQVI